MRKIKVYSKMREIEIEISILEKRRNVIQTQLDYLVDLYKDSNVKSPVGTKGFKKKIDKLTNKITKLHENYFKLQNLIE